MSTKVKICGLKTEVALRAALENGADYVGFVFFPKSPRNIGLADAQRLCALARGRATTVALMVDPSDELVDDVAGTVRPDMIQLHGSETPERCIAVRARSGCPIIKAVKVETQNDVEAGFVYLDCADLILFDAKAPQGLPGALPGGNGLSFDWRLLEGASVRSMFMLSGGLDPANVSEAIRLTGAPVVDVSSGVESAPGEKDAALIAAFLATAKAA